MTEQQVRRWTSQWNRGWSFRRIGEAAGVPERTVRRRLDGRVAPRRPGPRPRPKPTTAVVVRTWHQLGSIRATEQALGVSETFVRARLYEAGLIERHPDQRPRQRSTEEGEEGVA